MSSKQRKQQMERWHQEKLILEAAMDSRPYQKYIPQAAAQHFSTLWKAATQAWGSTPAPAMPLIVDQEHPHQATVARAHQDHEPVKQTAAAEAGGDAGEQQLRQWRCAEDQVKDGELVREAR